MKKFSKKLFCLMLVAIMVVAAIPFGAFAEEATPQDSDEATPQVLDGHTGHDGPAEWVFKSATATDHTLECSKCTGEKATKTDPHTWDATGKCTVCGHTHEHVFTTNIVPESGTKDGHKVQCDVNGCPARTDVAHGDEHFTEIAAKAATCTEAGNTAGKTYACGYKEGNEVLPALGHIDENDDGKCDRCDAPVAVTKTTYKVCVKLTSTNATLADGKSVEYTKTQVAALNSAAAVRTFLNGLGGKYAEIAGNMTDKNFSEVTTQNSVAGGDNYLYVMLTGYGAETTEDTSNKIKVIFDNGRTTYITREVGTWYFNTSNLGYDDTWGTEQAKLEIRDANGTRTVAWGSKDDSAYIKATDYEVKVLGINRKVTIYYMKSSTANPTTTDAYATKYYEANTQLGELPALPAGYTAWYVDGVKLTPNTVYSWETKSVYAYPGKGDGNGRVHLFIYNKNNELLKNVDVTESVQDNGLISRNALVSTIEYQVGKKNLTLSGLYTESGWAYYLNNKNSTAKAQTSVNVGKDGERQGTQNLYVVLTNVSGGSSADTSNPKTGDTAMIGTATIVMVLAAAGMGTAFYMKKKELF